MSACRRRLLICLALIAAAPAALATTAGEVIFATGEVTAERAPPVALAKGDDVLVSDTVRTGANARAQLLMVDGARLAIRPDSALRIDEYRHAATAAAADPAVVSTDPDRSVTSLLKGGFRTITGAIGKDDEEAYEVRTAVGVLGIRGTDYSAVFCNADCQLAPGATSTPPEDGLYLGVTEGIIFFRNEVGDIELRAGQYAFIPLVTRRPERLSLPPPVLTAEQLPATGGQRSATAAGFDNKLGSRRQPDVDGNGDAGGEAGRVPGQGDAPEQPVLGIDANGNPVDLTPGSSPQRPQPPGNRSISWTSGPLFGAQGFAHSDTRDNAPADYSFDASDQLTGFVGTYPGGQVSEIATFDIASSANAEAGSDAVTVMRWGRWAGGTAGITLSTGAAVDQDLGAQSLHWISSPDWVNPPVMPVTGVASYSLIGATSPTDSLGNVGVLGNATFDADFTNFQVTSTLTIDIAQQTWLASGSGVLGNQLDPVRPLHEFLGVYDQVSVDGVAGGTGQFSGFFSEPGSTSDPSLPGGVGLTYSLQGPRGQGIVSGAAAFGNP